MKTSATNRKIRSLITAIQNGSLKPRPEFQRRLVWTNKDKVSFLETVLLGYPFPEIYIAAESVDPNTGEGIEMLVDGQQRVTTLMQYFLSSADLKLGNIINAYKDLTDEKKIDFLEYEVVVRDLGKKSIIEIKEIFLRINSTKYSLNAMEIHNARFDGEFKKFGEKIAGHPFFEQNRIFRTNEIRRMGDVAFALTFLITVMSTYFNRDLELAPFLDTYNDEFERADELENDVEIVFSFVEKCRFEKKSRVWKKADLLTLLVEMHRGLVRNNLLLKSRAVGNALKEFYKAVDQVSREEIDSQEHEIYYKAALQATNDKTSRIRRGEAIRRVLENTIS